MIKVTQRIPTDQYAYIEIDTEYLSVEDAFLDHKRLLKLHNDGAGLSIRDWAKVRNQMMVTGECDPNLMDSMNHIQRYVINEFKLAIRAHKAPDPVINDQYAPSN